LSSLQPRLPLQETTETFVYALIRECQLSGTFPETGESAFDLLLDYLAGKTSGQEEANKFIKTLYPTLLSLPLEPALFRLPTDELPDPANLPTLHRMPFIRNKDFVGRESEMLEIARAMMEGTGTTVVTAGIGGIGKTQLAVEWAYRYGQFFKGGVFWLDFQEPASIPVEIAAAGVVYNFPAYKDINASEQANRVREEWEKSSSLLLIFDNCEDPELVKAYTPKNRACRVLITSRNQTWKDHLRAEGIEQVTVETLSRMESIHLLQRFRADITEGAANEIAEELGDLPLALHIAGSFLSQYRASSVGNPSTYLERLRSDDLLGELSKQSARLTSELPTKHERDVERTFRLSIEKLAEEFDQTLSRQILQLLANFAPGISTPSVWLESSLPQGLDALDVADAITRLSEVGLVDVPDEEQLRLHRLVAQAVLNQADSDSRQHALGLSEKIILQSQPEEGKPDFVKQMEVWLPHARHVTIRALSHKQQEELTAILANSLATGLKRLALYNEALNFFERGLEIRKRILGENHSDTARTLHDLAEVYREQGKYGQALPLYQQTLEIQETGLGINSAHMALTLNNIGVVHQTLANYTQAVDYYNRALVIRENVLGRSHADTAFTLNNIGSVYRILGNYNQALIYYEDALAIRKSVLGNNHLHTAFSVSHIAAVYGDLGNYPKAFSFFQRALDVAKTVLGEFHPETATGLDNIGLVHYDLGNYKEALDYCQKAWAIRRDVFGENNSKIANSLNNIGLVHNDLGNCKEALEYHHQALTIQRGVFGENHPDIAVSLNNIGSVHYSLGNYKEALNYHHQALAIQHTLFGENHPRVATSLNNIGTAQQNLGNFTDALNYYQQALEIQIALFGENHPDTVTCLIHVGLAHYVLENYHEALKYHTQALALQRKLLGKSHFEVGKILYNIAKGYVMQQKYKQALPPLIEAHQIYKKHLGRHHKDTQGVEKILRMCQGRS
jgi:tetratricopeptide (TPR) repeat protein